MPICSLGDKAAQRQTRRLDKADICDKIVVHWQRCNPVLVLNEADASKVNPRTILQRVLSNEQTETSYPTLHRRYPHCLIKSA